MAEEYRTYDPKKWGKKLKDKMKEKDPTKEGTGQKKNKREPMNRNQQKLMKEMGLL